jgi:hypothetical protein
MTGLRVRRSKDGHAFDLSKSNCHVCKHPLQRDYDEGEEWCVFQSCILYLHHFNIPYDTWFGVQR